MSEPESALLLKLQVGDPQSFEYLVKTFSGRLLGTAARILGSESDAQDVVQETLISAWKGIGGFEGTSSLHTWLHRITVRVTYRQLKRFTVQRRNTSRSTPV